MSIGSINTNITALAVANNLERNYTRLGTSIERLSSGLRVNSAADDAAGLAIRELMRADVAALQQGARNANDAISLLQVADGALAIIDEKLIRMKELAEQAATGTYDSTQRLMIASEFQLMGEEINRIARATEFNGIKLLDGSLSGAHDGGGVDAKGKLKIHFGSLNDSAEDYYYIDIADCTLAGLGLAAGNGAGAAADINGAGGQQTAQGRPAVDLNDYNGRGQTVNMPRVGMDNMQNVFRSQGVWHSVLSPTGDPYGAFMFRIPQGTKNIVINATGGATRVDSISIQSAPDNDLQLFTTTGKHLAGTPLDDWVWDMNNFRNDPNNVPTDIDSQSNRLGFTMADYDATNLNSGPAAFDPNIKLNYSSYGGMNIGYTGDNDRYDSSPNDGVSNDWPDYEVLTIDEAKEDLIVYFPGYISGGIQAYWDLPPEVFGSTAQGPAAPDAPPAQDVTIETQEKAQKALVSIDKAMVRKDKVRAHLGALQNRLENTVSNITIQSENLKAAESRISDADVAAEMMEFVRNQILTQSATAMLSQANSFPHMLSRLLNG